jgi:hypothetical protein
MSRVAPVLCIIGALASASTSSFAFDGHRKGFVLGFGAGPAMTSFTQTVSLGAQSVTGDRENKMGLATDFRIGAGVTEQFSLYYVNRVSWFSLDNALGKTVTIANSVGLLGATYYFQPVCPSPYIHGLLGLASWDTPFESGSEAWTGMGLGGGIGYELAPHWSLEGSVNYGIPSRTIEGLKATTNAVSIHLTVNALAF